MKSGKILATVAIEISIKNNVTSPNIAKNIDSETVNTAFWTLIRFKESII